MKRMVKNGDLIDVEPDGTITVAGKPIGGGENDREITLTVSYNRDSRPNNIKIYVEDDVWNNINNLYYDTVSIHYNNGDPMVIFSATYLSTYSFGKFDIYSMKYTSLASNDNEEIKSAWYGDYVNTKFIMSIECNSDSEGKYITVNTPYQRKFPNLDKSKFDALYKLADKPTQDGTYVLKATVSGGAVTYTWVAQ